MTQCPCGSEQPYTTCCGIFIDQNNIAATPEQLMRSRYTAYSTANIDYIVKTMRGPAAVNFNRDEAKEWATSVNWLGLTVINTHTLNNKGWVEFIASFKDHDKPQAIHEKSEFHRINGQWYYVSGKSPK